MGSLSHPHWSGRHAVLIMRRSSLFLLTSFLLQAGVEAAEIRVDVPFQTGASYLLDSYFTNDDQGAVYDSATTKVVAALAWEVFSLGNHSSASVADLLNIEPGFSYNIRPGEVDTGWSATGVNDGTVRLTNNGYVPDATFTTWQSSSSNPSQDTMALRIVISNDLLELNATSGYQPFTLAEVSSAGWDASLYDAVIVRSDSALLLAANYTGAATPGEIPEAFVGDLGGPTISTTGLHYLLLSPGDFAEWTDFASEHPALAAGGDANGNGRSNFIDYATGQDPEAPGLLAPVELSGNTLTLRRRTNGIDAQATAQFSDTLDGWDPLEEGVHYTLVGNTVDGTVRTLVLDLLPGQPGKRFFRQAFTSGL